MMSKNILVIDDEESVRVSLVYYLEDEGFNVYIADSAEKALKIMQKEEISIALVDMRLPGMDGDLFIQKAHKKHPKVKFLIYTGSTEYRLSQKLINIGMTLQDVILKPSYDLSIIKDAILNKIGDK